MNNKALSFPAITLFLLRSAGSVDALAEVPDLAGDSFGRHGNGTEFLAGSAVQTRIPTAAQFMKASQCGQSALAPMRYLATQHAEQGTTSPSRLSETRSIPNAAVRVGVDSLGRVLAGIDENRDDVVDLYMKFTDRTRILNGWSATLRNALVQYAKDGVVIHDRAGTVSVVLAIAGADRLRAANVPARQSHVYLNGIELGLDTAESVVSLGGLDFRNVDSWPEEYRFDLLTEMQGTFPPDCNCVSFNCNVGGCSYTYCSISSMGSSCQKSCGTNTFACCRQNFDLTVSCYCIPYSPQCFE